MKDRYIPLQSECSVLPLGGEMSDVIFLSETMTAERYQVFIMNFVSLLEVEQDCWFQLHCIAARTGN
jgi:hypothetical protein